MKSWTKLKESGNMRAIYRLIAAASIAVSAMTGCQEEQFRGDMDPDNYYASVETFDGKTKTALGADRSVVWSSDDRIAVFENGTGTAYEILDSYVGKSSGEFSLVEGLTTEGFTGDVDVTMAAYPFDEGLNMFAVSEDTYEISGLAFPAEQTYTPGSFADLSFPMVAVTSAGSRNLSFKNVGGVLKLSLTGDYAVSNITLKGNSGELLSGTSSVTVGKDGIQSVQMDPETSGQEVTLLCDPAVQLDTETATDFYISLPPTDFEAGFTVTITNSEGASIIKSTSKRNNVGRSMILVMPGLSDDSLVKMTYSDDYIEGSHSFIFSNGNFLIFTPDSLGGYYITIDALNLETAEIQNDPIYAQCDSLMRPVFALYSDAKIYFTNYTDNTVDFSVYIDGQMTDYKGCPFNHEEIVLTKASTEGSTGLDNVGTTLDLLSLGMSYVEDGKKGLIKEAAKQIGMKALPDEVEPWVGWAAGMVEIWKDPKNKLGIVGMVAGTAQAMKETAELSTKLLIGDITPYLIEVKKTDKNAVTVKFKVENYSNSTKDVPMGTIHYSHNYAGWQQGDNHHINGTKEYYEETISYLRTGNYRFRAIVYPSVYIGHPLLQQYYGFKTEIVKVDISPLYMSELVKQSTTKDEDLILTSVKIKLDYMSEEDKIDIHNSGDYGVCISQEGKKEYYSALDPNNNNDEFHITLNLPFKDFKEQKNGKYIYEGDLKFYTYKTTLGIKELRDERTLEITYPDDEKWVDLGLPSGILWAAYNVGATSPEEYGGYYAWGETEEKSEYTWENYKFYNSATDNFNFIGSNISNTKYDVAHVKWGEGARMPTLSEIQELVNMCTFSGGRINGVRGLYATGPNGNSIFLPFAGGKSDYEHYDEGERGYFLSGTHSVDCSCCAYCLSCSGYSNISEWDWHGRYGGKSIRPVKDK